MQIETYPEGAERPNPSSRSRERALARRADLNAIEDLETDGGRFHSTRSQIERDRRKEADLVRAGYRVLRATSRQVEREPQSVALTVAAALTAISRT